MRRCLPAFSSSYRRIASKVCMTPWRRCSDSVKYFFGSCHCHKQHLLLPTFHFARNLNDSILLKEFGKHIFLGVSSPSSGACSCQPKGRGIGYTSPPGVRWFPNLLVALVWPSPIRVCLGVAFSTSFRSMMPYGSMVEIRFVLRSLCMETHEHFFKNHLGNMPYSRSIPMLIWESQRHSLCFGGHGLLHPWQQWPQQWADSNAAELQRDGTLRGTGWGQTCPSSIIEYNWGYCFHLFEAFFWGARNGDENKFIMPHPSDSNRRTVNHEVKDRLQCTWSHGMQMSSSSLSYEKIMARRSSVPGRPRVDSCWDL